jgi:succinate-semialdehyde dehydrogenase/glutarate-semialdehyde dehydrogenase
MSISSINPFTNIIEQTFEELDASQIDKAIEKAAATYQTWKDTPMSKRSTLMAQLAKVLKENEDHYAKFPVLEMGKLMSESKGWEVDICIQIANYYAKNAKKFMAPETLSWSPIKGSTVIEKHPIGVLLGIMPWNYPYYQVFRFAVPNIMAGNTVIIKHASNIPQCAIAIEDMFRKAGFPEGVYTNVLVSGRNTSQIIKDPRIKGVSLTGSESAGAKVAALAGQHLKKVVLELGGSDPFVLLDDADIDYASTLAVLGRFFNCGQTCIASKRFIIHEKVYDEFLEKFIAKTKLLKPGNPLSENTNFGPMSSEKECALLLDMVNEAVAQGAKIATGGQREKREGAWLQPTILTNVTRDMDIYHKELFGPVAVVHKVKNDEEAIALANDSDFGLSSVVVCKDKSRANKVAQRIEAGMTYINTISITEPDVPFGGVKNSGFGRELSKMGIEEFINRKTIRKIPVWAFKQYLKSIS